MKRKNIFFVGILFFCQTQELFGMKEYADFDSPLDFYSDEEGFLHQSPTFRGTKEMGVESPAKGPSEERIRLTRKQEKTQARVTGCDAAADAVIDSKLTHAIARAVGECIELVLDYKQDFLKNSFFDRSRHSSLVAHLHEVKQGVENCLLVARETEIFGVLLDAREYLEDFIKSLDLFRPGSAQTIEYFSSEMLERYSEKVRKYSPGEPFRGFCAILVLSIALSIYDAQGCCLWLKEHTMLEAEKTSHIARRGLIELYNKLRGKTAPNQSPK